MYLVHVYRDEAADDPDVRHGDNPFDGIELYAACKTEDEALRVVDRLRKRHRSWHWHIEPVHADVISKIREEGMLDA